MAMQLIIKAANQKIPDHPVEAQSDWTISRLKEILSESYPSHPRVEDQKLIHGGRLLHNHLLLRDVLRRDSTSHVLHLVCSTQVLNQMSRTSPPASDVGPVRSPPSSPTENRNVPLPSNLHYRGPRQHPDSSTSVRQFQVPAGAPGIPISPEVVAQQMAAMQQFYAQYMAQFVQHAQAVGMGPFPDLSALGTNAAPPPDASSAAARHGAEDVAREVAAPADPPRADRNVRMNAQGGPLFEEDDEVNRDWLDWFYVFSRAFVLFSIVFFYSSPGRFMMVLGISIIIYMYQGGWFRVGGGRRQERPVVVQENLEEVDPAEEANEREETVMDDTSIADPTASRQPQLPAPRNHPSTLHTIWTFVSSFFTSLVPEQPPPINVN